MRGDVALNGTPHSLATALQEPFCSSESKFEIKLVFFLSVSDSSAQLDLDEVAVAAQEIDATICQLMPLMKSDLYALYCLRGPPNLSAILVWLIIRHADTHKPPTGYARTSLG